MDPWIRDRQTDGRTDGADGISKHWVSVLISCLRYHTRWKSRREETEEIVPEALPDHASELVFAVSRSIPTG